MSAGARSLDPGIPARPPRPAVPPRQGSQARPAWRRTAPEADTTAVGERPWIRLVTFTALAAYGLGRWATLMEPSSLWRLAGLLAIAVVLAGGIPLVVRRDRVIAALLAFLIPLLTFPVSGVRWHWFVHLRVAATTNRIEDGLTLLPNTLVPYLGSSADVRLVIVLGAAVLLLDAALVVGFAAGASLGDGRRAAAALPLIALAIVPTTLNRPQWPYVQGLVLFMLLAAFLWGERVRRRAVQSALVIVVLAGVAAAVVAPHIDQGTPWVDYRAWTGTTVRRVVDRFDWNQTYGPLRWPKSGHEVMTVQARTGEYWKAQDLDLFNGVDWVSGTSGATAVLPSPKASAVRQWTQTIRVSITGMQSQDVIAAGVASSPPTALGSVQEGADPGTWVAGGTLGPGTTYEISTYAPHPTDQELETAGTRYPDARLGVYLSLAIPQAGVEPLSYPQVQFPLFHSKAPAIAALPDPDSPVAGSTATQPGAPSPTMAGATVDHSAGGIVRASPYAGAYALARHLAAEAPTPYAFVESVMRYLAHGYAYDQNPPAAQYPLETFLFTKKEGYCQQFSGAMAMLLRMGGLPARVASGFTTGTYLSSEHGWVVDDTDAHAWVEVWFPGYGWVSFDPTPGGSTTAPIQTNPAITKGFSGVTPDAGAAAKALGSSGNAAPVPGQASSGGVGAWPIVGIVLGVLAVLGLGEAARRHRRRPSREPVDELERALTRTRRPLGEGVTLAVLEHRLREAPAAAAYVRSLRLARYGGSTRMPTASERRALRLELARGLGVRGYLRALWALPPRLHRPAAPVAAPPAPTDPGRS